MNKMIVAVLGGALGALVLGGCSSPEPIDITTLIDEQASDAVGTLVALEADLNIVLEPDVDLDTDGAQQWRVNDTKPRDEVLPGEDLTLRLQSGFDRASRECGAGIVEDDGSTLIIDMKGEDANTGLWTFSDVDCLVKNLNVPASTLASMTSTRALDGRQSDDWDGIEAEWSYHPDKGLDIILTLDD